MFLPPSSSRLLKLPNIGRRRQRGTFLLPVGYCAWADFWDGGVAELEGFCNVMFHCFDHEIVLEGMKEEISQQRCTIGAHWYTNNLPENRASKTNVDVVDKNVNSETKLSTREVCVPHGHPIIRPEGAKRISTNEAFPFRVKNSFQKIMKLVFLSRACGRLV